MIKYFFLFIFFCYINAQIDKETRAIWLTTNFQLDWPPKIRNQESQKKALIDILDDLQKRNINTIFFQVRGSGTVLYYSNIEPMPSFLSYELNVNANYDPLKFVIKEAKKRSMELHAWVNMIRCFASSENLDLKQKKHLINTNPEWIIKRTTNGITDGWLDPGIPEVESYLVDIIKEIIYNYDVDGVHLDFLRYPGMQFKDETTFQKYANGINKDDWRRENINRILSNVYKTVKDYNKNILVGIAPFGIYKNTKQFWGAESYKEVYQDTQTWIDRNIIDYVVPQIYWDLSTNPKFNLVVEDWSKRKNETIFIAGLGIYKPEIFNELESQIEVVRKKKSEGMAFFRYEHLKNANPNIFEKPSLPFIKRTISDIKSYDLQILDENINGISFRIKENIKNKIKPKYFIINRLVDNKTEMFKIVTENYENIYVEFNDDSVLLNSLYYIDVVSDERILYNEVSNLTKFDSSLKKLIPDYEINLMPSLVRVGEKYYLIYENNIEQTIEIITNSNQSDESLIFTKNLTTKKYIIKLDIPANAKSLKLKFSKTEQEYNLQLKNKP